MSFSDEVKKKVWEKATKVDGYDPDRFRKDVCGAWIKYDKYGATDDIYGWQIDHVYPQSLLTEKGVTQEKIDDMLNLRPMQWENNQSKGDNYPTYSTTIAAEENKNIRFEKRLTVNDDLQKRLNNLFRVQ